MWLPATWKTPLEKVITPALGAVPSPQSITARNALVGGAGLPLVNDATSPLNGPPATADTLIPESAIPVELTGTRGHVFTQAFEVGTDVGRWRQGKNGQLIGKRIKIGSIIIKT